MELSLNAGSGPLLKLDLGEADKYGYFDDGDLHVTSGNLYLALDGEEYGSLFFFVKDGKLTITLGQFDYGEQEWVERNPLDAPVKDKED